jgi:hypothetical protein
MARLLQKPKEEYLNHLRNQINKKFPSKISSISGCDLLIADIYSKTQHLLSIDTIKRLLVLKKSSSLPSVFTLDVCAQYLDYHDWEDFVKSYLEQCTYYQNTLLINIIEDRKSFEDILMFINNDLKSKDLFENFNKIVLYKAQVEDEVFFKRIFEFHNIFEYNELHKYDIYYTIHILGSLCTKYDWLKAIAITHYHNISFDENYFVEWLVVPDKDYYFPLLENYYKSNGDTKSSAVFFHLIQCTYLAEQQDWGTFEEHFKQVIPLLVSTFSFNSILKMRWLGVQLYHDSHFNNGDLQKSIIKRIFTASHINEKDNGNCITAIFIISNYLTKLELYDVIIELYEQKCVHRASLLGHWGDLNLNHLDVHYALALLKTGKKEDAKLIFDKINQQQFDLNFKTRMLAIYDVLAKEFN